MDGDLRVRFDRVSRLYWWVPPIAVIAVTVINDLIADGGASEPTAFMAWAGSMFSILYYHSGLVFDNWRSFDEKQLQHRVGEFRDMLHPGVLLVFVVVHVLGAGLGLLIWYWIVAAFD